jgi:DNA topoisomerase-1
MVKEAFDNMEKKEAEKVGESCPECGSDLVIKSGKYGKFIACSNYPKCKYIKKEEKQVVEIGTCPECGGTVVEKKTRKGKIFYGCNNYPKCKYASWDKPNL